MTAPESRRRGQVAGRRRSGSLRPRGQTRGSASAVKSLVTPEHLSGRGRPPCFLKTSQAPAVARQSFHQPGFLAPTSNLSSKD